MELQQSKAVKEDFRPLTDDDDPNFDRKLDAVTAGGSRYVKEHLLTSITRKNCKIMVDYVLAMQTEIGPSQTYRIDTINKLKYCIWRLIIRYVNHGQDYRIFWKNTVR